MKETTVPLQIEAEFDPPQPDSEWVRGQSRTLCLHLPPVIGPITPTSGMRLAFESEHATCVPEFVQARINRLGQRRALVNVTPNATGECSIRVEVMDHPTLIHTFTYQIAEVPLR